jgi:hypothetical protein
MMIGSPRLLAVVLPFRTSVFPLVAAKVLVDAKWNRLDSRGMVGGVGQPPLLVGFLNPNDVATLEESKGRGVTARSGPPSRPHSLHLAFLLWFLNED